MKLIILGTGAAEGIPAAFCTCRVCVSAMREGRRQIRTRSQLLIDGQLLVDLNADTYLHKLRYGLQLERVNTLLITHSHTDHFYPFELAMRGIYYAPNITEPLQILCGKTVLEHFEASDAIEPFSKGVKDLLRFTVIQPFQRLTLNGYTVTALLAKHTSPEQSLLYLIERDNKTLFVCYDTARLLPETVDYLCANGTKIDVLLIDGTSGNLTIGTGGVHMGLPDVKDTVYRLQHAGVFSEQYKVVITHISHNGGYTHDEYVEAAKAFGFCVAYDGMKLEV